ncbi:hypothetical protein OsJ_09382 [Oryza sativa Japonica Group]|uniref:Uncharacterized protein n=1 Tax=Oryza sativa subsp. japonica TaxID=39947 RepID=B9FB14_ORYSJ|nr:hypothetical protein OsJ_09382 [Oryza sativa Japonica Group]
MEDNLALAAPHIQSEKRAPTTSALQKIPKAAKPMTSDNGPVPMRKSPPNDNTWCSIHETSQHPLIDCKGGGGGGGGPYREGGDDGGPRGEGSSNGGLGGEDGSGSGPGREGGGAFIVTIIHAACWDMGEARINGV